MLNEALFPVAGRLRRLLVLALVVACAAPLAAAPVMEAAAPSNDWSRLREVSGHIMVSANGIATRNYQLIAVDDEVLTVVDMESANRTTVRIRRSDVNAVRQWTGRSGSPGRAAAGVALGFGLGSLIAVSQMYAPCGGDCFGESALVYGSLIGMPVAFGVIGFKSGNRRTLTTIYTKP